MVPRSRHATPTNECRSCGSSDLLPFFDLPDVPTHVNFLWDTEAAAVGCPRGRIHLAFCRECALITNITFDPNLLHYREGYENSLHHSSVFRDYAESQADRLIERLHLRDKTIVEIGCGQGDFLRLLCRRGGNRGVGFDPSYADSVEDREDDVRIVRDTYDERHANVAADFILSRQTLEHIPNPQDMLGPLRRSIGNRLDTPVFFEVPNASYTLHHAFIWDVIYEHTSYFTAPALETTLARAGFHVSETYESFGGQYLCVTAYPVPKIHGRKIDTETRSRLEKQIDVFQSTHASYVNGWRDKLQKMASGGKSLVLWGAGSKGVMFANLLDLHRQILFVVDVNPKKHDMYVAGRGQRIVPPAYLAQHPVDTIIVANPIYKNEIAQTTSALGLTSDFLYL